MSSDPRFNCYVVFNTNDSTFHDQAIPLVSPSYYPCASLAFFYYTRANRLWSERFRQRSTITRYVHFKNQRIAMH